MKEETLINDKKENLRTKIYLMVITLDLNLVNNNTVIKFKKLILKKLILMKYFITI